MNIAFVVSDSIDQEWGHRTHILEVGKELAKKAEVHMYLPRPRSFVLENPAMVTVPVISVPAVGFVLVQVALFCRLLMDARCFRPQIIYARHSPLSIAPLLAAWCLRVPIVVELNSLTSEDLRVHKVAAPIIRLAELNEACICRYATGIVAVSEGIASAVGRRYSRSDAVVIANGVDCALFRPNDRVEAVRQLGLAQECEYICFVGNLASWQGLTYLIEAMARVARKCPHVRALIVGSGEEETALKQKARELGVDHAVLFAGSVPNTEVPVYISAATVCVAPFERRRNEQTGLSPLKLYEYMACSRPVVSTDVPGVNEILRVSEGGVLIPAEDADALASALIERLCDLSGSEALGWNGRRYVTAAHCWFHVADRILTMLEDTRKHITR